MFFIDSNQVKGWPLYLILFGLLALLLPQTVYAGETAVFETAMLQGSGCGDGNEISVSFDQMIRSDRSEQLSKAGPISVSIEAGEYDIQLTSFDEHGGDDPHAQAREQWYVLFRAGEDIVATSGTISDLPDTQNSLTETVNQRLSIPRHVDNIVAVHAAYPDPGIHSVVPACVGLRQSTQPKASIGDRVWLDENRNGIQDNGESGMSGVAVHLFNNGNHLSSTSTDGNGFYLFSDLEPGTYTVKVDPLADYFMSPRDNGDDQLDSDADPNGWMHETTLDPNENDMSWDAGMFQKETFVEVVGFVYCDANQNGAYESNEKGLKDVQVQVSNGDVASSTMSNSDGQFSISNLPEGNYEVVFVPPAGYTETSRNERGERDLSAGFAGQCEQPEEETASIGNYVWLDYNKNGTQDNGEEPVQGVTLVLYREGGEEVGRRMTDANGYYLFSDVEPGNVYLQVIPPANYSLTNSDQGGNDDIDSDFSPENGFSRMTALEANEHDMRWDAGLIGKGKPDACARFNLDLGRNALTGAGVEGRYEMIEVGSGSLLASWDADYWWADSGWIEGIELSFRDGSWVEVFFYPYGEGPGQILEIINPAPGTSYGWLAPGICHAIEIQFPADWSYVQPNVIVADSVEIVTAQPVEVSEVKESTLLKLVPETIDGHCQAVQLPKSAKFILC